MKATILALAIAIPALADDYRMVAGKPYSIFSADWITLTENMRVMGYRNSSLRCSTYTVTTTFTQQTGTRSGIVPQAYRNDSLNWGETFVLTNYPGANRIRIGEDIRPPIKVMRVGVSLEPVSTIRGSFEHECPIYDYGTPWTPPTRALTPVEAEAAKNAAEKKKQQTMAATFTFHKSLADKGDARGQYCMGLHYLKGEGVDPDRATAKDYFEKSAAQGNDDAKEELAKLAKLPH